MAAEHLNGILKHHRALAIMMDKSHGTTYTETKHKLVLSAQSHICRALTKRGRTYPKLLSHVLANNFVEDLLEVARHYETPEQSQELLELIMRCYYEGVNSL